jgi:hypothetical protein
MANKNVGGQSGAAPGKELTEAKALNILGEQRFLSADRVVGVWNKLIKEHRTEHNIPPLKLSGSPPIRYTGETLQALAKDSGWYLLYEPGIALKDSYAIIGTEPAPLPRFAKGNDWWFAQREEGWVNKKYDAGYYLVSMDGVLTLDDASKDWRWQEKQIKQIGDAFQRAPTQIMLNALVSCFLLNNQRYLSKYNNFGPEMDADYCYITLVFDDAGVSLGHWVDNDWGGYWGSEIRVLLSRKFDF